MAAPTAEEGIKARTRSGVSTFIGRLRRNVEGRWSEPLSVGALPRLTPLAVSTGKLSSAMGFRVAIACRKRRRY